MLHKFDIEENKIITFSDEQYEELLATLEETKTKHTVELVESGIDDLRAQKLSEVGEACSAIIYAGIEIGGSKFGLETYDQIELIAQLASVQQGAPAVPWHPDGELCRLFPATEFVDMANAAMAHIFYHRTYCNHLNFWIKRATREELEAIFYGAELPEDLAASMMELIAAVGGAGNG